ncbi:Proclavaminate amidinohydrolase [Anaerohalosphaera lusitana]|uniref:Proclavaminate amidinohydrolase n=1 Tax=Anaerohalosphaera lusitana TaxID=1936003 RepID=A0A1U9NJL1_9BACT|nr:agmatinase [Anaerohalosphaera lusitana]AQT67696.1 Proclavaminate amidinohydrolase [Anaerohalosphaera lusitana]
MTDRKQFGDWHDNNSEPNGSSIVLIPVPYDETSTWQKGADKGPAAIIDAAYQLERYDIETDSEVYKRGIWTDNPIQCDPDPFRMVQQVRDRTAFWLADNKHTVVIGGEHSVSVGAIQAHAEKYENLSVLQLDAHADLRDEYEGSKHNHACVMARASEIAPCVQVGIRSMDASEKQLMDPDRVFFAEEIYNRREWANDAVDILTDQVYITIDLDVFDSSIMPSTGTPEPGGMTWYEVLRFLRKVAETKNIVGFDIAELCPNPQNKAPNYLAAKLIYKTLSYQFEL